MLAISVERYGWIRTGEVIMKKMGDKIFKCFQKYFWVIFVVIAALAVMEGMLRMAVRVYAIFKGDIHAVTVL